MGKNFGGNTNKHRLKKLLLKGKENDLRRSNYDRKR
nr:MAG TPA: hypothetical protein [Caudoviricetes sp.]